VAQQQDIISFTPSLMKAIHEEDISRMISNPTYFPIIKVLRKGPMTVKEIEKAYNKEAEVAKSDKTIYRYLKELEKANLVKPAGQRVILGKTATETLFTRTARAFYVQMNVADFWLTDQGYNLTEAIGRMLSPLFDGSKTDFKKLQQFFYKLSTEQMVEVEKLISNLEPDNEGDVWELMQDLVWQKFTTFFDLGGLLAVLIKNPKFMEELKQIFQS
jgi:predicted transcriptional regulator